DVLQKDVIFEIKNHKKTASIPILMMTGYTLRHHHGQLPIDDSIEKPFNLSLFAKKIEKLMGSNNESFQQAIR
ncbi:MAG: hypothetical protein M3Z92_01645, partial [Bacteroidota bacterium]|nr:hypothetical protein [Bacteroidota bacterium]